jgi:hypothetical protein
MPTRHTWTLLLLLVVALAPASARQEQLCHELISALQSDAAVRAANGVADEESAKRFLSDLLSRNTGKLCTALSESSASVKPMWLGERLDWIETEASGWQWDSRPQTADWDGAERQLRRAPLAEVEWRRQLLAEP